MTELWQPEPLVRARRRRAELAAEVESLEQRRDGARRGIEELTERYDRKKAELRTADEQIKEMEKTI